jgi:polysaccharide biosynthesis protein PslH
MKRILLISRCPPYPLHLGDRLIVYHLARELSQRGYAIDLLAFANRPEDWDEIPQYQQYFHRVTLFHEPRRSQLDYLKRALLPGTRWPRKAEGSWSPEMWRAIESQLAAYHYDVVHLFGGIQVYEFRHTLHDTPAIIVPYESYSLYLRRLVESPPDAGSIRLPYFGSRLKAASQIFAPRLACFSRLPRNFSRRSFSLWQLLQLHLARHFERWMFAPYRRVVVVSQRDKAELLMLNPELKIEVIPNGIDLSYFQPQNSQREPATLLFVGNYEYAPNVDAALRLAREILPQVRTQIPAAKLWLVGHAPPPEVQALASDTIIVTGSVPDVRPYLAQATAFVSPLRLGAGIKNKVLETLAMGCPVVATPLSVDGIDVQHERDVLTADDDALVSTIVRLLQDQDLQHRLSENGPNLIAERYSWARVATMYEELYRKLLD